MKNQASFIRNLILKGFATLLGFCAFYEMTVLFTYFLIAYFPHKTGSLRETFSFGAMFSNNFSALLLLFIAFVGFKIFLDIFFKKNTSQYNAMCKTHSYIIMRHISLIFFFLFVLYLLLYPVSYYLGGSGEFLESAISASTILVLAVIFFVIIFEKKKTRKTNLLLGYVLIFILIFYVVILGLLNFEVYGFPGQIREMNIDIKRASDLDTILTMIPRGIVPSSISSFENNTDPQTGEMYQYKVLNTSTSTIFSVCANFNNDYKDIVKYLGKASLPDNFNETNLKKGKSCLVDSIEKISDYSLNGESANSEGIDLSKDSKYSSIKKYLLKDGFTPAKATNISSKDYPEIYCDGGYISNTCTANFELGQGNLIFYVSYSLKKGWTVKGDLY